MTVDSARWAGGKSPPWLAPSLYRLIFARVNGLHARRLRSVIDGRSMSERSCSPPTLPRSAAAPRLRYRFCMRAGILAFIMALMLEARGELALLRFDDGKANAIDEAFLDRLVAAVTEAGRARALVVAGRPRIFSAGLALPSLVGRDRAAMRTFMNRFTDVMLALYTAPLPVVAAVSGHGLAGGCVLALMADRRVMSSGEATIGLNEVRIGIGLPSGVLEPLRALVHGPALTSVALEGRSFTGPEALAIGLVDEVAEPAAVEDTALARATALAELGRAGYAQIKAALRQPVLDAVAQRRDADMERWLDSWFSDDGQRQIAALVAKLSKRG
jgi:enoyl-CoA hydratase/carnithine racemase